MYILRSLVILSAILTLNLLASQAPKSVAKSPLAFSASPLSGSQAPQAITAQQARELMASASVVASGQALVRTPSCLGNHACGCLNCLEQFGAAFVPQDRDRVENKSGSGVVSMASAAKATVNVSAQLCLGSPRSFSSFSEKDQVFESRTCSCINCLLRARDKAENKTNVIDLTRTESSAEISVARTQSCSGNRSCDCPNCVRQFGVASIAEASAALPSVASSTGHLVPASNFGGIARTFSQLRIGAQKKS